MSRMDAREDPCVGRRPGRGHNALAAPEGLVRGERPVHVAVGPHRGRRRPIVLTFEGPFETKKCDGRGLARPILVGLVWKGPRAGIDPVWGQGSGLRILLSRVRSS